MTVAPGQDGLAQDIIKSVPWYAAATGSANAFVIALPTAPSAYADGLFIRFKANFAITGACTGNVNTLGAISFKMPDGTDPKTGDILNGQIVEAVYLGGVFMIVSKTPINIPFPVQDIPFYIGTDSFSEYNITSNIDGSVIVVSTVFSSFIYGSRFVKDVVTGNYYCTHSLVSISYNDYNGAGYSVVIAGNYIYTFYTNGSSADKCYRHDLATFTNRQLMTVSGTFRNAYGWGDGTNIYLQKTYGEWDKFTISGTTITNASTITYTSMESGVNISDGIYVWNYNGSETIRKYAIAGGAVISSTTFLAPLYAAVTGGGSLSTFIAETTKLGFGWFIDWNSAGATSVKRGTGVHLMAITLP